MIFEKDVNAYALCLDIGLCSFQKDCTHLYICMFLVCRYMKEIFIAEDGIYSKYLTYCRMDIVDQCSIVLLISVFGCHTNAFILKCT